METSSAPLNIEFFMVLSLLLFSIGMVGVMLRRNMIVLLMCIELMLNSVNLLLVAFSLIISWQTHKFLCFFIVVVAAAEATVGLSIIILAYRKLRTIDISLFNQINDRS